MAWVLTILMLLSAFGCSLFTPAETPPNGETPGNETPGKDPEPGTDPGVDPEISEPTDNDLTASVTPVPPGSTAAINYAVIRQGDLWLGIDGTRLWRQTASGDVDQVVWAPDGHALAFFTTPSLDAYTRDLYTLIPGGVPVLVDRDVVASFSWPDPQGFLWSPDSSRLAYGLADSLEIVIAGPGSARSSFSTDIYPEAGPFWLGPNRLVLGSVSPVPLLLIVDTQGTEVATVLDTALPYPIADGLLAAAGEYGDTEDFFFTGLVHLDDDGANASLVHRGNIYMCFLAWNPQEENRTGTKYFALSDGETLFLQNYAAEAGPRVELLTQDLFLTFSEFAYPFWFAWAPDGDSLAALPFTFSQEGDYGEQKGSWDLVQVDREGRAKVLLADLYTVQEYETPVPFWTQPIKWSPDGAKINYLVDGEEGVDLWQLNLADKTVSLFLLSSELPEYRP